MDLTNAFDTFQQAVNADSEQVNLARERRKVFKEAFKAEPDVLEVFGSGSLARSTQLKPVHDVDLIVVFDPAAHESWGAPGSSSVDALDHVGGRVNVLLGSSSGIDGHVRLARRRDRAVKCFIDPPEQDDAFTVDVMPVLRQADGTLLIPSKRQERWSTADPEYLINEVATKQQEWAYFRPMVRVLKNWRLSVPTKVKSLVIEVLALQCLPTEGSRPDALKSFFTAAAVEVNYGVEDPAKHCGLIQPDLDVDTLRAALENARDLAEQAYAAAARGHTDVAGSLWRELFGDDFPASAPENVGAAAGAATPWPQPVPDSAQG
ncbi:nucleotidyltransferase domain-containing protein [Amycolatopsis sp. NPDC059657]|uniref:SMODS domain-containing nucleotidyltransferase n=1 Tax=Amycolatopsis sp. NPDC059657 TaxID=3346899 RepID=UPI00367103A9